MQIFVMATRVDAGVLTSPQSLEELERQAATKIEKDCAGVEWLQNLAVCGPYDYIDVFRAPDLETAQMVSMIVRTFGRSHTELWPATDWQRFKRTIERTSG